MKERWNERAARDPFFFVETSYWNGDVDAFFELGEERTKLIVDPVLDRMSLESGRLDALDLGCGLGRFTRALSRRFRTVLGVDVSDGMVRDARELNPELEYPNITFVAGDGLSLPVVSASADFVLSYEVFQHMPSEDVITTNLREVRRVLRPTGVGLLHFPRDDRLVLRFRAGRAVYGAVRAAKNQLHVGGDKLVTDPTFSGAPAAGLATIVKRCRDAWLDVVETSPDTTNTSHVFAIVRPVAPTSP
jgi:SAM-dependent methyltransferase